MIDSLFDRYQNVYGQNSAAPPQHVSAPDIA
jgi:hypothetical protein